MTKGKRAQTRGEILAKRIITNLRFEEGGGEINTRLNPSCWSKAPFAGRVVWGEEALAWLPYVVTRPVVEGQPSVSERVEHPMMRSQKRI